MNFLYFLKMKRFFYLILSFKICCNARPSASRIFDAEVSDSFRFFSSLDVLTPVREKIILYYAVKLTIALLCLKALVLHNCHYFKVNILCILN